MGKKARSARGQIVDFDLMKIKEQIASAPTPMEVKARQDFIESRLKRRIKKATAAIGVPDKDVAPTLPEPAATVDESHIEDDTKEVVSEALAAVEESVEPVKEEKKVVKKKTTTRKTTKQVARPTKTTQEPE